MTNDEIARFFNNTQAFIQGNSDLRDPQVEGWFRTRQHFRNGSAAIKDLLDSTSLFPFRLMPVPAEHLVSMSLRLELLRHGLDDDLVMLREEGQAAGNGGAK